jgi:hypothetical protein
MQLVERLLNFFSSSLTADRNKLECFVPTWFLRSTRIVNVLALQANIRLACKNVLLKDTVAYFAALKQNKLESSSLDSPLFVTFSIDYFSQAPYTVPLFGKLFREKHSSLFCLTSDKITKFCDIDT